ncbi:hypothetical protein MCUN1_003883 [Malassezia cuniculi]|uniref:Uncharacterized protein n=1 Tax=Malassezia cuniculi TaxID=948313 RepID=A0AAF0JDJ2_9BASI|nr:hypothetical protein MCUN1_003883 [Malassezia cuniculi]
MLTRTESHPESPVYTKASAIAEAMDHSSDASSIQRGSVLTRIRRWRVDEVEPEEPVPTTQLGSVPAPGRRWSLPGFRAKRQPQEALPITPERNTNAHATAVPPQPVRGSPRGLLTAGKGSPTPTRGRARPLDMLLSMSRSRSGRVDDVFIDSPSDKSPGSQSPPQRATTPHSVPRVPVRRIPHQSVSSADASGIAAVCADPNALGARLEQRIKTLKYLRKVISGNEAYLYRTTLSAAAYRAVHTPEELDAWAHGNVRIGMALGSILELDSAGAVRAAALEAVQIKSDEQPQIPFAVDVVLTLQTMLHVLEQLYQKLHSWTPDADVDTCTHIAHTDEQLKTIIRRTAKELASVARGIYAAELDSWDRAVQSDAFVWECLSSSGIADAISAPLVPRKSNPQLPHRRSMPLVSRKSAQPTASVSLFARGDTRGLRVSRSATPLRP